ncbi:MAG: hypothetical protein ACFFBD_18460 [Candidatus Hodarchaeota archaeon]
MVATWKSLTLWKQQDNLFWKKLSYEERISIIYDKRKEGLTFREIAAFVGLSPKRGNTIFQWADRNVNDKAKRQAVFKSKRKIISISKFQLPKELKIRTTELTQTKGESISELGEEAQVQIQNELGRIEGLILTTLNEDRVQRADLGHQLKRQLNLTFEALRQVIYDELRNIVLPPISIILKLTQFLQYTLQDQITGLIQQINSLNATSWASYNQMVNLQDHLQTLQTLPNTVVSQLNDLLRENFPSQALGENLATNILSQIHFSDQALSAFSQNIQIFTEELKALRSTGIPSETINLQEEIRTYVEKLQMELRGLVNKIETRSSSTAPAFEPRGMTSVTPPPPSSSGAPPPPPPPTVSTPSPVSLQARNFDWEQMGLEDIQNIPPETLESLSLAERKKMNTRIEELRKLEQMSPKERKQYLQEKAKAQMKKDLEAAQKVELREALKKFRLKADADAAQGKGVFGKVSSWVEYWYCKKCNQKFVFTASKSQKRPSACKNAECTNKDQETLVKYDPRLESDSRITDVEISMK